jgi:hypothetical protein
VRKAQENAPRQSNQEDFGGIFCSITADKGSRSKQQRVSLSSRDLLFIYSLYHLAAAVTSFINSKRNCAQNNTMSLPITLAVTLTKRCQNGTPK